MSKALPRLPCIVCETIPVEEEGQGILGRWLACTFEVPSPRISSTDEAVAKLIAASCGTFFTNDLCIIDVSV